MHKSYYSLMFEPFTDFPHSGYSCFFWAGENQKAALGGMKKHLLESDGIVLLSGEQGQGKKRLINALLSKLHHKMVVGRVNLETDDKITFFNTILKCFNIDKQVSAKIDFFIQFSEKLKVLREGSGNQALLVVDNAHRMTEELLEEIVQITTIEENDERMINVLLVGDNQMLYLINNYQSTTLSKNLIFHCKTKPLTQKDSNLYINHRMQVSGNSAPIFSDDALDAIHLTSKGNLDKINAICTQALKVGFSQKSIPIDKDVIHTVGENLGYTSSPSIEKETKRKKPGRRRNCSRNSVILLCLLFLVTTGGYFFYFSEKLAKLESLIATNLSQVDKTPQQNNPETITSKEPIAPTSITPIPASTSKQDKQPKSIRISVLEVKNAKIVVTKQENSNTKVLPLVHKQKVTTQPVIAKKEDTKTKNGQPPQSIISQTNDAVEKNVSQNIHTTLTALTTKNVPITKQHPIVANNVKAQNNKPIKVVSSTKVKKKSITTLPAPSTPEKPKSLTALQKKKRFFLPKKPLHLQAKPNSDFITEDANEELLAFTKTLLLHPKAKVLIEGFIASDKTSPENVRLSERRANIVKKIMVNHGIDKNQISVIGRGNQKPIASNSTPTGRRKNRRIEISVIEGTTM